MACYELQVHKTLLLTHALSVSRATLVREDLSTGYGRRFSTEIYRSKREKTNTYWWRVLFLQKSSKISGDLQEFTG